MMTKIMLRYDHAQEEKDYYKELVENNQKTIERLTQELLQT